MLQLSENIKLKKSRAHVLLKLFSNIISGSCFLCLVFSDLSCLGNIQDSMGFLLLCTVWKFLTGVAYDAGHT